MAEAAGALGVGAVNLRGALAERARREGALVGSVPVRVASGGVAEGAAQLMLAPVFGRADG